MGYSCVGSADQFWYVESNVWDNLLNFNGFYSGTNNDVVGVSGGSTSNGAALVLWWSDGSDNQFWDVIP